MPSMPRLSLMRLPDHCPPGNTPIFEISRFPWPMNRHTLGYWYLLATNKHAEMGLTVE